MLPVLQQSICVELNITHQCQNRCSFCYNGAPVCKSVITFETFQSCVRAILNEFGTRYLRWEFSGGEPTLHPKLFEMIHTILSVSTEAVGQKLSTVFLVTNGIELADQGFCRNLVHSGVNGVRVTLLNSSPEIHDAMTNRSGSHAATLHGIQNLLALGNGIIDTSVHIVLTQDNAATLGFTVDYLIHQGVHIISVNRAMHPIGKDLPQLSVLSPAEYLAAVQIGHEIAQKAGVTFRDLYSLRRHPNTGMCNSQYYYSPCGIGRNLLVVEPDATVVACDFYPLSVGGLANEQEWPGTWQMFHRLGKMASELEHPMCE